MTALVSLIFEQGTIFIIIGLIAEITIIGLIVSLTTKWAVKKTIQSEFDLSDEIKQEDDERLKQTIERLLSEQSSHLSKAQNKDVTMEELKTEQKKMMNLIQYLVKQQKRSGK